MNTERSERDQENVRKDTEASMVNDPETTRKIKEILGTPVVPTDQFPTELKDGKDWRPAPSAADKRQTNQEGLAKAREALDKAYKNTK